MFKAKVQSKAVSVVENHWTFQHLLKSISYISYFISLRYEKPPPLSRYLFVSVKNNPPQKGFVFELGIEIGVYVKVSCMSRLLQLPPLINGPRALSSGNITSSGRRTCKNRASPAQRSRTPSRTKPLIMQPGKMDASRTRKPICKRQMQTGRGEGKVAGRPLMWHANTQMHSK